MTDWPDGYLTNVTYSTAFYRHTTPIWLSLATLLSGHRPPRIDRRFRWCDLGCGHGFTALGAAACHPEAEVFAYDFSPAHIDNAQVMAAQAGVSNVAFSETSFTELAACRASRCRKWISLCCRAYGDWQAICHRRTRRPASQRRDKLTVLICRRRLGS